ncbi:hypothetical protein LEN26_014265 [Aphanomyces euteiches]|nr:hypothetical protein AeMF1_017467 [Aphanomyces euteiches]KAH9107499.1 hypothetical protein LEN26_014265 [Aphanomyces euteiches]
MVNVVATVDSAAPKTIHSNNNNEEENSNALLLTDVVNAINESVQEALKKVVDSYGNGALNGRAFVTKTDDDVQVLLEQLTTTKQAQRTLSQKVEALEVEKKLTDEKLAMQFLLISKLKAELVNERLAAIDVKKDLAECMAKLEQSHSTDDDVEQSPADPWQSPSQTTEPSKPSLFRFYSASHDPAVSAADDLEPPSPMSTSRNSLMDQYIPSSLLDSPCVTPSAQPVRREKHLPTLPSIEAFSLDDPCVGCSEHTAVSILPCQHAVCVNCRDAHACAEPADASKPEPRGGNLVTLSLLCELFDTVSTAEVNEAFTGANGNVAATMDALLQDHAAFNPDKAAARAAVSRTPVVPPSNWKTEMCMYYLQGKCNKTRRTCSFAHGESDLVRAGPLPKLTKTRLCPLFLEGACPKTRRDCHLAHGESDLAPSVTSAAPLPPAATPAAPRLQNYKTELCYYYLKGCCNYSTEECRFAHGESDLRTVESNTLEWVGVYDGGMNLQHQQQYQQLATMQPPPPGLPPPPLPPSSYRYKDDLTKRRVTIPARRESMNAHPTSWSTYDMPHQDY